MPKLLRTTRQGLTRCPACLSHVALGVSLEEAKCPFCGVGIVAARQEDGGRFGAQALALFGGGASGRLAAALGVSLVMSACDPPTAGTPGETPASTAPAAASATGQEAPAAPAPAVDAVAPQEAPAAPTDGPPEPPPAAVSAPSQPASPPGPPQTVQVAPARPMQLMKVYGGPPVDREPSLFVPEPEPPPAPEPEPATPAPTPKPVYGGPPVRKPPPSR